MKHSIYLFVFVFVFSTCQSQTKKNHINTLVGGSCEGCEAVYEYGERKLKSIDTLPGFEENKSKLKITGTVFKKDGKTPAKAVILYVYHTDRKGIYPKKGGEKGWAKRHGFIRGWIKTGADGKYTYYTFRPAAYPNSQEPEHIHMTLKEPDKNAYYIDDYIFDDDPLLTSSKRRALKNRGGSGIVKPILKDGIMVIKRDIILGLNIPDYR